MHCHMPRPPRIDFPHAVYHVTTRGNGRDVIFWSDEDRSRFLGQLADNLHISAVVLYAYVLMENHLVLWPYNDGDLSRWMQWLMTSHVRRYHGHYRSSGHVWQGRFKAFPIQDDDHLWTVLRYVERNALRANLVRRAEDWPWCSAAVLRGKDRPSMMDPGPVPRSRDWLEWVNQPQTEAELAAPTQMH
jgi:putative transposase